MRRWIPCVALAACGPSETLTPPSLGQSTLVVTVGGVARVFASDRPESGSDRFELPDGTTRLYALALAHPLSAYALVAGEVSLVAAETPSSRRLPVAEQISRLDLDGAAETWREEAQPAELEPIRLPAVDPLECASLAGCWGDEPGGGCVLPCPEPSTPMEPTRSTAASMGPCIAGWRSNPLSRVALGVPFMFEECIPGDCPEGLTNVDGQCHPPSVTCALPLDLPSSGVFYLRAGAAGDGSRANPSGDLAAAVASRAPVIALDPGAYAWPSAQLAPGVRVVGACYEQTVITGSVALNLDANRFEQLTLDELSFACVRGDCALDAVRSRTASASVEVLGGRLTISRSGIESGVIGTLRASRGSEIHVRQSDLSNTAVVVTGSATGSLDDVRVLTAAETERRGVSIGGASVMHLRALHVSGRWREGLLLTGTASVSAEQVYTKLSVVAVTDEARLTARALRVFGSGNHDGLSCSGSATIDLEDVVLSSNAGAANNVAGFVLRCRDVTLRRILAEHTGKGAFVVERSVDEAPSRVLLEDVVNRKSFNTTLDGSAGDGLTIRGFLQAELRRGFFGDLEGTAIEIGGGADAVLRDVRIVLVARGGIHVDEDTRVSLERVRIETSGGFGLSNEEGSVVTARDLSVDVIAPDPACPRDWTCAGVGVAVRENISLSRFVVSNARSSGVVIRTILAGLSISDGELGPGPVGLAMREDEFKPSAVLAGVRTSKCDAPISWTQ